MTTAALKHNNLPLLLPVTLLLWFLLILGLSMKQFFITEQGVPPFNLLMTGGISLSAFFIAYWLIPQFRDYVLNIDMRLLILLHSWRTLGLGFIMLYYVGELPALFSFLAGFGDAIVAFSAVFLTYAMFTNKKGVSKKTVWRWNTFGLLDFIIAVGIGVLTRTDAILFQSNGISSDLMTQFPLALVPAFLVQIFTLSHIIIYLQLKNKHQNRNTIRF
ncbi:MAG: hypothetical protein BMS9Abin31_0359 [Gammaproteobacteria bacterium]|nr:MAG: hypothetical protein BMS9Abin31_0359 [Gammaproteobacteria bacterium]